MCVFLSSSQPQRGTSSWARASWPCEPQKRLSEWATTTCSICWVAHYCIHSAAGVAMTTRGDRSNEIQQQQQKKNESATSSSSEEAEAGYSGYVTSITPPADPRSQDNRNGSSCLPSSSSPPPFLPVSITGGHDSGSSIDSHPRNQPRFVPINNIVIMRAVGSFDVPRLCWWKAWVIPNPPGYGFRVPLKVPVDEEIIHRARNMLLSGFQAPCSFIGSVSTGRLYGRPSDDEWLLTSWMHAGCISHL